ncbi:MAG TPA: ATP-dependent helicase C-terminal domain-containing protein [Bryobacteraceae bacterium]|jgi:ATP-dependent helicase HrpB|nr:ATP-dependent helicase C-terminal domain-containing protein [Bryobacteraceae bacterium]
MKLPIDALLPQIAASLAREKYLVIEAPPGAGKTTRIPPALLPMARGEIIVLEPRRLAARMAARRVASELGERVGKTVGYQVRFEDVSGPRTRIRFVTEGVLTRRLMSDPQLRGVDIVILDEFHERHLDSDLALALLKRLDVRIVVMSATLDAAPVARFLGNCPVLRSEGKLFELKIEYTPHSAAPLEEQIAAAVQRLGTLDGDVLVFLPGAAEIRRAARALERSSLLVVPLHGDLSPEEQDRAVARGDRRKVILSTNVAESSITIEGVTAVIDSGLARVATDSPWTGLPSLDLKRISQASATQRAGRAGRTAPGRVIRLYTAEDFHRRLAADAPEILRRELSHVVLQLRAMKMEALDWLDAPPEAALAAANKLLDILDATPRMAELPLPPRLAKLVTDAAHRGVPEKGCAVAAVLSAGERGSSDLLALAESDWQPQTRRVFDQLRRMVPGRDRTRDDAAILQAILAAFPDRVARHRRDGELLLSQGGSARLPDCRYEFLVAVDVEDRRDKGLPLVRLAAPIEPEWLLDRAVARTTLEWNRAAERMEQVSALLYDQLVIEETRAPAPASEEASKLLASKALEVDIGRFVDRDALDQLLARAAFAGVEINVAETLTALCRDRTSFAEITDVLAALRPARIDQLAPEKLRLPGGRELKVNYETGKPPWIESRLQDFFGVSETPRVGKTPVVVHLLAPNRRPVQVTSDLKGFWERLYPQVRKELSRRYPKHKWPEKPA